MYFWTETGIISLYQISGEGFHPNQNAAQLQLPLTAYLKNSKKKDFIDWTDASKESFYSCKMTLSSIVLTTFPIRNHYN